MEFISTFDELPLWSASFGLMLLKHLEVEPNLKIVDIGSGTGFPLLELAGRFGNSCKFYGVDPWRNANDRARKKIGNYDLENVEIIESSANSMPFEADTIDLIVSNLGINNFENTGQVFLECKRILKPNGKLVLTTNLNGHWKEFYRIFEMSLEQLNKQELLPGLIQHQLHRGTVDTISKLYTESGFTVNRYFDDNFTMKFQDGSAFLNHYFVKLGWLQSWRELLPKQEVKEIFLKLEANLNALALAEKGLEISVPMLFMEGVKNK
ncbi:MAG: class I SAM-dependent methyltransferase [Bacteroidetes bacterium]|nr:class I SAM-dependent methyltransferase [Bacteroidota bacterium]